MIRKDESLNKTIFKLDGILKGLAIPYKIHKNSIEDKFYSVNIQLKKNKFLCTNGKGNSYEQAIASGLAELLERLQSGTLITPNFLNFDTKPTFYKNFAFSHEKFNREFENLIGSLIKNKLLPAQILQKEHQSEHIKQCSDYFCQNTMETTLLPYKLIRRLTHSNGLSAGNTKDECLVQGICEIFERHCFKTIVMNNLKVNIIDVNELKNAEIYSYIDYLIGKKYAVKILDFSLGKFPVVAVLIEKDNKYAIAAGSDVDLNIALFRCFNELFQGLNSKNYHTKLKQPNNENTATYSNWLKFFTSNNGNFNLNNINTNVSCIKNLPFKQVGNNQEAFSYLFEIIKQNNLMLYYKDFSFTTFPTYHTYIPTLSEVQNINEEDLFLMNHYDTCKKFYYNLNKILNKKELKIIVQFFEILSTKNTLNQYISPAQYFKSLNFSKYYLNKFNFNYLLFLSLIQFNYNMETYLEQNKKLFANVDGEALNSYILNIKNNFPYILKKSKIKKDKYYNIWNSYYNKLYSLAQKYYS